MNTSHCRLLLVDDDPHQLKLMKLTLEGHGYTVNTAQDGQEALEILPMNPPDGVISDVLMPRLDGFQLCYALRKDERFSHLPIVLLSSAFNDPEDLRLAKDVGANALVARTPDVQCLARQAVEGLKTAARETKADQTWPSENYQQRVSCQLNRQARHAQECEKQTNYLGAQLGEFGCALSEAQDRLCQIEENMRDVFFIVGNGGQPMHYVSPGYEKTWGRTCQSLYENPLSWLDAIHPADRPAIEKWLGETKDGDTREYRITTPDGKTRWIRARIFQVQNPKNGIPRWVGSAEDITERKKMEEQLRHSQKLESIGQVAAGVAHELNNPLGAILGFTQCLLSHPDAPDAAEVLRTVEREAQRCCTLVKDMLIFARKPSEDTAMESLPALAEGVLSMIGARAKTAGVIIERHYEAHVPSLRVNGNQIQQVLINLCTNAIDAMPKGGTLSVSIARAGGDVVLRVTDTGEGIAPEHLEQIFEAFFTTKAAGKGTGLGLSLVQDIVAKHKGHVEVQSEPNRGTTFQVYLPAGCPL